MTGVYSFLFTEERENLIEIGAKNEVLSEDESIQDTDKLINLLC